MQKGVMSKHLTDLTFVAGFLYLFSTEGTFSTFYQTRKAK
jgi:hypothetical protein